MFTFFLSKGSSAVAPHILLEEVGASYQVDERSIPSGAHLEPDYLQINPKARVPALATPDGVLTENPAILWYIGEAFPQAGLLPEGMFDRARLQELNAYLCATVHVAFAHKQRGHRWSDDAEIVEGMKAKVASNLEECAALIEAHYLKGPWVLGDTYSISDPYLFLVLRWLKACDADASKFPKLSAHQAAMLERRATQDVLKLHAP